MDDQTLSARAALLAALIGELRDDETLMGYARGGIWSVKAQPTDDPQIVIALKSDKRTSTFGGEAFRTVRFELLAYWDDSEGQNFLNGERMLQRARHLLDGGQSREAAQRVRGALTPRLHFHGWKLLGIAELEDEQIGKDDNNEPEAQVVGQDSSDPLFSMGCPFLARLKRL